LIRKIKGKPEKEVDVDEEGPCVLKSEVEKLSRRQRLRRLQAIKKCLRMY
jgi:hypothetical protein